MVTQREIFHELQSAAAVHTSRVIRDGMSVALATVLRHQDFNAAIFDHEFEDTWRKNLREKLTGVAVAGFIVSPDRFNYTELVQSKVRANLRAIGQI